MLVSADHGRIDRIPIHRSGDCKTGLTMLARKFRVASVSGKCIGEFVGLGAIYQCSGDSWPDDVCRSGGLSGNHRQGAGHRLVRYIAKGFGNRGIEEHVGARERSGEIVSRLLSDEKRLRQLLFKPGLGRALTDYQHAML